MSEAINLTAIIISSIALISSLASVILVLAQRFSTHKIEWKPLTELSHEDVEESQTEEETEEEILEKALLLQREGKKAKYVDPLTDIESTNF